MLQNTSTCCSTLSKKFNGTSRIVLLFCTGNALLPLIEDIACEDIASQWQCDEWIDGRDCYEDEEDSDLANAREQCLKSCGLCVDATDPNQIPGTDYLWQSTGGNSG